MAFVDADTRNTQVLIALNENNAIWCRCGGAGGKPGLDLPTLLQDLQEAFPDAGWSSTVLDLVLRMGHKTGLYKSLPMSTALCPPGTAGRSQETQYYLNSAMVYENYPNIRFSGVTKRICIPRTQLVQKPIL